MNYNEISFHTDFYKKHGRCTVDEKGAVLLSWSSNGIEFNFTGSGFIVNFGTYSADTPAYLRVYVDGSSQRFALVNGSEKICYDGLEEKLHNVKILRVTEGSAPVRISSVILCGEAPEPGEKPVAKRLKLEFFGDSITCGYGVMGNSNGFYYTYEQDSTNAYAHRTAELLDADATLISVSGKGIVANCEGNREDIKISEFYAWANQQKDKWDFSRYTPDVVVINAGTNDSWGGVSKEEFAEAGFKLLCDLRSVYPHSKLLWAYGIMDDAFTPVVKSIVDRFSACDKNTYYLHIPCMVFYQNEVGGGGHPNLKTTVRASALLAEKIESILK